MEGEHRESCTVQEQRDIIKNASLKPGTGLLKESVLTTSNLEYRWCQSNAFEIWEDEAEQQVVLGMADFDEHCFRHDVDFEEIKSVRTGEENMERIRSQERGSFQWSTGKLRSMKNSCVSVEEKKVSKTLENLEGVRDRTVVVERTSCVETVIFLLEKEFFFLLRVALSFFLWFVRMQFSCVVVLTYLTRAQVRLWTVKLRLLS